jgi:hypothetical protein
MRHNNGDATNVVKFNAAKERDDVWKNKNISVFYRRPCDNFGFLLMQLDRSEKGRNR